jgi:hypothetical protein
MYSKRILARCGRSVTSIFFLFCLFRFSATADTIFSDFGSGDSVQGASYCVDGASIAPFCSSGLSGPNGLAPAALFVSTGSFDVTQIDVALTYVEGPNDAVVALYTDVSNAPGSLLGSWTVAGQPPNIPPVTTISGISGIALVAGGSYFIEISPGNAGTEDMWNENNVGLTGDLFDPPFGGQGLTLPAFDLIGTVATPEPSSLAVCLLAFAGALAVHLGRRKSALGAAAEPSVRQ